MSLYAVQYRYDQRTDVQDKFRPTHRAYLQSVAERGLLRGSGPYTDGAPGALLVFDAPDRATLDTLLADDPFALAGVIAETTVREWKLVIGPWAG